MKTEIKKLMERAKPLRQNGKRVYGLSSDLHEQWLKNFSDLLIEECLLKIKEKCDEKNIKLENRFIDVENEVKKFFGVKNESSNN